MLAISASAIAGDTALADGGGLFNDGHANLVLCTVTGNSAGRGRGIYNDQPGTVELLFTTVSGNKEGNGGGNSPGV